MKVPILENFFNKKVKNIYRIRLFCEMVPNKKNSISKKHNKLFINYKFSKIDYKTIKILSEKIFNYFSYNPMKEKKFINNKKYIDQIAEDASHHIGGMIYSADKKVTCVDKNLRIYGLNNIFICSSAIFPTSGSVNPTMTICALANRLAIYIDKNNKNNYKRKN